MEQLQTAIEAIVKNLFNLDTQVTLTRPDPQFGDFATNVALQLAKELGKAPRDIATELQASLQNELRETVSEVSVAGPGFINLRLNDQLIIDQLGDVIELQRNLAGKQVVIEYSDPNPFKELHAGHLYTTLVGDAVSRLLEAAGGKVHRLNYGGDVGLHVGKAMWGIITNLGGEKPDALASVPEADRLGWLSSRYVEGNTAYDSDEAAKTEIVAMNKRVYEVHSTNDHDSDFAKMYWTCRAWSYDGFDKLYDNLEVSPFERYVPESEVTPLGLEVVEKGLEKGIFIKSEGAVVFSGEEHGLHTRVFINSAGLPTYEAKDLGLAAHKWQKYHFDLNVIITANDIIEYMKVVVQALSNFYPEVAERTRHYTHGMIKLPGGVKMSSRLGNILQASTIIEAAEQAGQKISEDTSHQTILAAIKYAFLKARIGGDIIYDPEEAVATEGNSGPYLQYAHARACSILNKSNVVPKLGQDLHPGERTLAVKLTEYCDIVARATDEIAPHLVCTYLYELAQTFNRFYENSKVIGDSREADRLYLVSQYAAVLKSGLNLLGIHAPEKM